MARTVKQERRREGRAAPERPLGVARPLERRLPLSSWLAMGEADAVAIAEGSGEVCLLGGASGRQRREGGGGEG